MWNQENHQASRKTLSLTNSVSRTRGNIVSLKALVGRLLRIRQEQLFGLLSEPLGRAARPSATATTPAQQEFERLGPWMSRFVIDGISFGGEYDYSTDPRLHHLERRLGSLQGKRVLELGALEGGHTLELARAGATVVAIEGRSINYERCLFVKRYFRLENVEFALADLRSVDFTAFGRFDVVLNSGVLYHMDAPWDLLERLGKVAPSMLLWTHCAPTHQQLEAVEVCGNRLGGYWYSEGALDHPLSGRQSLSFWPTRESLEQMLCFTGWSALTWLDFDADCQRGPAAMLWADRNLVKRTEPLTSQL